MKKMYSMFIGIDVSKLKLDVWMMKNPEDSKQEHFVVTNNEKGIKEIIKIIEKEKTAIENCLFCFENTGIYSMPLCYYFSSLNLNYWVVNALEIKRSKGLTRGKNDKNDSKEIAFYAFLHLHKLKLTILPEKEIAQLKIMFTERDKLIKATGMLEQTKEAENFVPKEIMNAVSKINTKTVSFLKARLKEIESQMEQLVQNNEKINEQIKLVKSVPGIGSKTALYLVLTTKCFESFDNWRQLACYAGIAPFEYSSGTSIRGRTKVNHLADKKMKSMLQMCVLSAIKHDAEIKAYYTKKKKEGKHSMLIMNNVRCKIIARVFAVVDRGTPFVNTLKFAA